MQKGKTRIWLESDIDNVLIVDYKVTDCDDMIALLDCGYADYAECVTADDEVHGEWIPAE